MLAPGPAQESGEEPVLSTEQGLASPPPTEVASVPTKKSPWLGISISKPNQAIYAQISKVPDGAGFTIDGVEPASPAMLAGVRQYDLLWKFDDQILFNEAQLLGLLALKKDGDKVTLTCFRGGETIELNLVVRSKEVSDRPTSDIDHVLSAARIPGLPWQTVDVRERIALVEDGDGIVKVARRGDSYVWEELSADGILRSRGSLQRQGSDGSLVYPDGTAPALQRKLAALVRAYEQAASRARGETRLPRVRRVPDAKPPSGG